MRMMLPRSISSQPKDSTERAARVCPSAFRSRRNISPSVGVISDLAWSKCFSTDGLIPVQFLKSASISLVRLAGKSFRPRHGQRLSQTAKLQPRNYLKGPNRIPRSGTVTGRVLSQILKDSARHSILKLEGTTQTDAAAWCIFINLMAYDAFISYSHTADVAVAGALQSALHSFAKPWYRLRAVHIFRDQTNLAVNPALWSSIRDALDQSQFLILFASPEAASSPWVAKEAEHWISRNGTSHVLIILTGGTLKWDRAAGSFNKEQTSALRAALLDSFSEEPLFLDLLWTRDETAHPGFRMR